MLLRIKSIACSFFIIIIIFFACNELEQSNLNVSNEDGWVVVGGRRFHRSSKIVVLNGYNVRNFDELKKIDKVEMLYLNGAKVENIEGINNLQLLKRLEISGGSVTKFDELQRLKKLEVLKLKNVRVKFSEGFKFADRVSEIDMHCSIVSNFNVENLTKLKYLIIADTNIREMNNLPSGIGLIVPPIDMPKKEIKMYKQRSPNTKISIPVGKANPQNCLGNQ